MLHPYYPIYHQPGLQSNYKYCERNPGSPDTELIKLLKSVSNQSRSWQEDGIKKSAASGILPGFVTSLHGE
jgi:hypothetical protein